MTNTEIEVNFTDHEHEIGSLKHRVENLEKTSETIHNLAMSVNELAINMKDMLREQEKQGERIENLESQPAKHWSDLITVIITAIASGIITYCFTNLM